MKRCLACDAGFEMESWSCPECQHEPESIEGVPCFAPELAGGGTEDADYDVDRIFEIQARHFWYRARSRLLARTLKRHFPGPRSFLELGCGTGFGLSRLRSACPDWRLSGSDPVAAPLLLARSHLPEATFFQMDARRIPFRGEFDVVGAFDVLEHIDEDGDVLEQIWAALEPGGGVVLTVPQHGFLWGPLDEWSHHRRRYSRADLEAKLERAGFELRWATSFVSLLMPLLLLSRLRDRAAPQSLDPAREFDIGAPLNWILSRVMALELGLIRMGVTFPFGGSLLVVAVKPS